MVKIMTDNPLAGKEERTYYCQDCESAISDYGNHCADHSILVDSVYKKKDVDSVIKSLQDEIERIKDMHDFGCFVGEDIDLTEARKRLKEKDALIKELSDTQFERLQLMKEKDAELYEFMEVKDLEQAKQISTLQKELEQWKKVALDRGMFG